MHTVEDQQRPAPAEAPVSGTMEPLTVGASDILADRRIWVDVLFEFSDRNIEFTVPVQRLVEHIRLVKSLHKGAPPAVSVWHEPVDMDDATEAQRQRIASYRALERLGDQEIWKRVAAQLERTKRGRR